MPRKNLISLHEAIVLALIVQPARTADFKTIAEFIEERSLYPIRKAGISLETQVMLRATKSQKAHSHLFEEIGANFIRLKDSYADFPLQVSSALDALLSFDSKFYQPGFTELSVVDKRYGLKQTRKLKFRPSDIICIVSQEKSRKKDIYFLEDNSGNVTSVEFNSNNFTFETLCEHLDRLNHYLVVVSKSVIVNVAFFDMVNNEILRYCGERDNILDTLNFRLSRKINSGLTYKHFTAVKEAYNRRIFLQKTVLGYKMDTGTIQGDKFET